MSELIGQSAPVPEADVCVEGLGKGCWESTVGLLLGWTPTLWPSHGPGCRVQGLKVKQELYGVCVCVFHPPNPPTSAALGPMSLMQFWTKFYSQLGRPLPKVCLLLFDFYYAASSVVLTGFLAIFVFLFVTSWVVVEKCRRGIVTNNFYCPL